jgi:hypothetical protein
MAINVKQSGSVLFIALIFCAASSICLLLIFETRILETMMARYHQQKSQILLDYVVTLRQLEIDLENKSLSKYPKDVTFVQWVPDTLVCNETEGIAHYQINHKVSLADGARGEFTSTYAIRGAMPEGSVHPNTGYCGIDWQSLIIPLSKQLPISVIIGKVIIGPNPKGKGVLLYMLAQKKYHLGEVLLIAELVDGSEAQLLKVIDMGTHLHPPILRSHQLIINDDEWVMQFDAFTGEIRHKEKLQPISYFALITEVTTPIMQLRKPREAKRLILCPTSSGWAQAEIDIDYSMLGRKAWHEE